MKLFDFANSYIRHSDWRDLAIIKICLCAGGVVIGGLLPSKARKPAACIALVVFIATYIPLMLDVFVSPKGHSEDIEF